MRPSSRTQVSWSECCSRQAPRARPSDSALAGKGESAPLPRISIQQTDPGWLPEFQAEPRTRLRGRGSRTPSSRPGGPPLPAEATWPHRGDAASGGESPGDRSGPGLDGAARTFERQAVTRQPQGNPLGCTPLVANGSGHPSELGGTRRTGNGALGGPKAHRKLQTHPSLASQGSKKSKGSTKSAASQIPLQAQEAPGRLACRLLRPLHPVLPVLRVPDAVQHRPGLRHVRLLQLRGLVPLLLLLRLRRVCRLRPALRPGLRHPGRLLRVGRLPGDLHGVLWALLLLLTRGVPGCHTRLDRPLPRASPTLPEPSRNPSPVRVRCRSSLLVSLDNST
ncbi:myoD family inhibitor isoform X3 [Delphinapterus leucas]|uniref:MyoD family inhibitor isoform X3 n=1 Tax=Delphinapterus leucas TaxID=9749 RepID=A0A7F8K6I9_DELLE|nr:myoD family inhibitor isoform X3 [Delphinapterus leucas]